MNGATPCERVASTPRASRICAFIDAYNADEASSSPIPASAFADSTVKSCFKVSKRGATASNAGGKVPSTRSVPNGHTPLVARPLSTSRSRSSTDAHDLTQAYAPPEVHVHQIAGPLLKGRSSGRTRGSSRSSNVEFQGSATTTIDKNSQVELVANAQRQTDPIDALIPKLPVYKYSDPEWGGSEPTVVYITSEEEANEMIPTLRGPIGFDMEWKVTFGKNKHQKHGQTALVQVADSRTVLLIHLAAMPTFPTELKRVIEDEKTIKMGVNIHKDGIKIHNDFHIRPRGLLELTTLAKAADPYTGRGVPGFDAPIPASARGADIAPIPGLEDICHTSSTPIASGSSLSSKGKTKTKAKNKTVESQSAVLELRQYGLPYTRSLVSLAKLVALYTGRQLLKGAVRTSNWEQRLTKGQVQYAANDAHCAVIIHQRLTAIAKKAKRTLDLSAMTTCVPPRPRSMSPIPIPLNPTPSGTPTPLLAAHAEDPDEDEKWTVTPPPESAPPSRPGSMANILGPSSTTASAAVVTATQCRPPITVNPEDWLDVVDLAWDARPSSPDAPPPVPPSNLAALAASSPSHSRDMRSSYDISSLSPSVHHLVLPSNSPDHPLRMSAGVLSGRAVEPRHLRAYRLWHVQERSPVEICGMLGEAPGYSIETVITFIVGALQADAGLPFNTVKLRELVSSHAWCQSQHGTWVETTIETRERG